MGTNRKGVIKDNSNVTGFLSKLKTDEQQYPILSKEQERELIDMYREDEMKWRDLFIMHNIRMVFSLSKKYATSTTSYDDMVQRGFLGLAIASRKFDPDMKRLNKVTGQEEFVKFSTYATSWVFKYIVDEFYQRSFKVDSACVSMNQPIEIGNDPNPNCTLENVLEESADPYSFTPPERPTEQLSTIECTLIAEDARRIVKESNQLSAVDKAVFDNVVVQNEPVKNVARKFKLKIKDVNECQDKCIALVKDELERRYGVISMQDI